MQHDNKSSIGSFIMTKAEDDCNGKKILDNGAVMVPDF